MKWRSVGLYEHPAKHRAGTFGTVERSDAGVYFLRVGSTIISCPQEWAAKIHHEEGDEKAKAIILRNVPESLRRKIKVRAATEGKTMQGLILEILTKNFS